MRYLDTSSLVALYYPEEKSELVAAHLQRHPMPLAFTALHEVEFTNALQLKLFRRTATTKALAATLGLLRADVQSGVLQQVQVSWPVAFTTAARLARVHSRSLGTRTLDLLHIATALAVKATEFITADERQAQAAMNEGLDVVQL
ncbi:hypothetical protein BH20VER1_BH20VER1_01040 [soil metagenome]